MRIVATAGHVDHGKSTLVRALTGTDPDRLAEERSRGLTIDLGFAWTELPTAGRLMFLDVPGHLRFIKNMLAGVSALDACVLVVDVGEGWRQQTEEHLRILEQFATSRGLVVVAKADTATPARLASTLEEVAARTAGTFLAAEAPVVTDARSGRGLDELVARLDVLLATAPPRPDLGRPRLWIDRRFSAQGSGTVVTGTLTHGTLRTGEAVVLLTRDGRREGRIRQLQSLGRREEAVAAGSRVAINLAHVERSAISRGDVVVKPDQWHLTRTLDASLSVLASSDVDVTRRGAFLAYLGSGEHAVTLRVLGDEGGIRPGSTGLVRLHLPRDLPLLPGDRYVLRDAGRGATVGGGEVLDVDPRTKASRARPDRSVARVVAERGWVQADELERLTGARVPATLGPWVVDAERLAADAAALGAAVAAAGAPGLELGGLDERRRLVALRLGAEGTVEVRGGRAYAPGLADTLEQSTFLAALRARPFDPPSPEEVGVGRQELLSLVQRGRVMHVDGFYFATDALEQAARVVAGLLAAQPAGVTVSEVREALGTTRKWALPLLDRLDAMGVTRRQGDVRVGGPKLPPP